MGSGTYYAVGFGCADLPDLGEGDGPLSEIFDKNGIQTSYEAASNCAVVPLLDTSAERWCPEKSLPQGVVSIEELSEAIRKQIGEKGIEKAVATWRAVQAAAAALKNPISLPDGKLLWFRDYD